MTECVLVSMVTDMVAGRDPLFMMQMQCVLVGGWCHGYRCVILYMLGCVLVTMATDVSRVVAGRDPLYDVSVCTIGCHGYRCVVTGRDPLHAGVRRPTVPGSQRQRDAHHDPRLQVPRAWPYQQGMLRVSKTSV